jgi:hypothetical protein
VGDASLRLAAGFLLPYNYPKELRMSVQQSAQKEVHPAVVGVIALVFIVIAAIIGGRVGNLLEVLGGWGFSIGFTVMMWKRTDSILGKIFLLVLLFIVLGVSARLTNGA